MGRLKKRTDCPLSSALDIIGDKWSLLIIRDIAMNGKSTYNEFLNSEEKIATNVLAGRLAMLEKAGLLTKGRHPDSKAKILYSLTKQGLDLLPVMVEIILWSDRYLPISVQAKELARLLQKNKERIIKQIKAKIKV